MNETLRFTPDDPRVRRLDDKPVQARGEFVLYWMQIFRRAEDNAALAYAIERANELGVPCVVYEALRPDYPFASDRLHTFVLEGAKDVATRLRERGLLHAFFLPRSPEEARGKLAALAKRAKLVVTDDYPAFVVPAHNAGAAKRLPCPLVLVDDSVIVPLSRLTKPEIGARTIRPKVHALLGDWLRPLHEPAPKAKPPRSLELPFDPVDLGRADVGKLVAAVPVDRTVPPVPELPGGTTAGEARLDAFLRRRLATYDVDRNEPARDGTSALSPYLHFGHLSARRVALETRDAHPGEGRDAFFEQLVVRRALAFNFVRTRADHASWTALPDWARATLSEQSQGRMFDEVSKADLEAARSPDVLWNAAMNQLRVQGVVHGYARMLWGKLPIAWLRSPAEAHAFLVHLNDKWALDGRDPNGYANISWCFGLHDRPWPKRAPFGAVRTMTTASARRKLDFEPYIERWTRG